MPIADYLDGKIIVETEYRDKDAIKLVPGMKYDGEAKRWHADVSWATCKALRGVFGDRLTVLPTLAEWAWAERTGRVDPALGLRAALDAVWDDDKSADGTKTLYPPQRAGIAWLRAARSGLLGDPMGSGKTMQIIKVVTNADDAWPVLVVSPNRVKGVWRDQMKEWNTKTPVDVRVLSGSTADRRKQLLDIKDGDRVMVVTNWENVRLMSRLAPFGSIRLRKCVEHGGDDDTITESKCEVHAKELNNIPWRTVVVDEAHRAKDAQSKQTRAVWALQHAPTVRYRYSATGTPLADHLGDLWTVMHGCAPDDFARKSAFIDRYALTTWNQWGGLEVSGVSPATRDELFSFLDPRFRHVPKDMLLPFLPPKVFEAHEAVMSPKQKTAYNDMANSMIADLESGVVIATNPLAQYTRMSQFAAAYAEVNADGEVQLLAPSCKVDAMMEIIEDIDENESVAVAMMSRQLMTLCEERLTAAGVTFTTIKGGQTDAQSDQNVRDFQDRKVRVILLMIQAGGVGITLTTAPHLIMLQRSWSIIDNQQVMDRVHRIGSEKHARVVIHDVYTAGTFEVGRQLERLGEKEHNLQEILRDSSQLDKFLHGIS